MPPEGTSSAPRTSHGPEGIRQLGHREYVGGLWAELGHLQFDFLCRAGLQPHHYLLDIACGSLRGGVHFIPYLESGHYLGIDKEEELIKAGVEHELGEEMLRLKRPRFVVSNNFEFDRFGMQPDFALAQSLFTHLPAPLIERCFRSLRQVVHARSVFYATFFLRSEDTEPANPDEPHDWGYFAYTREQMQIFGTLNGWSAHYIGDWNHPRSQKMVRYVPA